MIQGLSVEILIYDFTLLDLIEKDQKHLNTLKLLTDEHLPWPALHHSDVEMTQL